MYEECRDTDRTPISSIIISPNASLVTSCTGNSAVCCESTVKVDSPQHISCLTAKAISSYVTTRLHFYVKCRNTNKAGKR